MDGTPKIWATSPDNSRILLDCFGLFTDAYPILLESGKG